MNKIILSAVILVYFFLSAANAQNGITVIEALEDLNNAEIIQFDSKTKKENKLYKRWQSYPQISKVLISGSYDTLKLNRLINEIAKNENIDNVFISAGERNHLPMSLSKLSGIKVLKIYNSPNLDQQNLIPVLTALNQLSGFSWINNKKALEIDISKELPNLKTIELIDSTLQKVLFEGTNISAIKSLESLSISIPSIGDMVLNPNELGTVSKINLIDLKKYKSEESIPEFLEIENDLSAKFYVIGDKTILIEYFGNSSVIIDKEKLAIQGKMGGKQIAEWHETNYSKTAEPIPTASPTGIIENDLSSNFEHKNPAAVPPIKTLVLPKTIYSISNASTSLITRANGTTISIPPDAFLDKNGNEVKENITISYKEYLDPLSIFASGIPMTYDSGGVKSTFTSAGMFEIYAFKGNEELQLKPGKTIDIEFASVNDGKNYNFYQFDENKKEWKYESPELAKTEIDSAKQTSNFNNILEKEGPTLFLSKEKLGDYDFDTTCFQGRFEDLKYFNLLDYGNQAGKVVYWSNYYDIKKRKKHFLIKYSQYEPGNLFKINFVSKPEGDTVNHALFTFNSDGMLKRFPELRTFYGYIFYSEDFEKYKYLKDYYFKDKIYSDVRMEYEQGDDYCTFILKTSGGFVDFKVNIRDVNRPAKPHYFYKLFYRRYLRYKSKLAYREASFNQSIAWKKTNFMRQRRNLSAIGNSKFKNDTSNYGYTTWSKPINSSRRAVLVKTGLYNCDVQFEPVAAAIVDLNLKNEMDSSIKFEKIFLFDEDMNGYITYDTKKIVLQPETTVGIIASTAAGALYYITKTGLENKDFKQKEVDIQMKEPGNSIKTISDLAKLFRR